MKKLTYSLCFALMCLIFPSQYLEAQSCTQTLSPGANIANAVSAAASGSTVCLNSGSYGNLSLANITKTGYVTLRSVTSKGATLGDTSIYGSRYLLLDDLVIGGGGISGCSQHIQIRNSRFVTNGLVMRNDGGCTPTTNLDITLDGNTFNGLPVPLWEGRLSIGLTGNPSGIVITNNTFGGGGCSDGIQLVGGVGGVQIGPGNIFRDLVQGSCGPHVDSIQTYGAGPGTRIEGNYFVNNTVDVGIYDGDANVTIRDNVFDRPNAVTYQALQLGGINTMLMEHNTFKDTLLGVGTKFANSPNTNWVVQNNIFDNSIFSASGDQPGCGSNCIIRYNLKSNGGTTNPTGTNNITGNAVYVGVGSVTNWAGWQLTSTSPGFAAGSDGEDMGTNYYGSGTPPPPPPPDTQAPTAPSGLTATPVSSSQINLDWTASTDNIGVSWYEVERCQGAGCNSFSLISLPSGPAYSDTGLTASTSYSYRVRATDAAGNLSGYSAVASGVTSASGGGGTITMGETGVLVTGDNGNGNLLVAQSAQLSASGTVQSISFYITAAAGNLRLGIYDATGPSSGPGQKKAETASFTAVTGWNTQPVVTPVSLSAGTYWLAYLPSDNNLAFVKGTDSTSSGRYYGFSYGPMPSVFSTTPSTTGSHWSLYATLSTGAPADTTPPSTAVTSPSDGSTVSGSVTVTASASDNVGVTGVQFKLDGSNLGAEDTSSPYSISWNTPTTTDGLHALTSTARDAAGNTTTSSPVNVTVANADITVPTQPTNLMATAVSSSQIDLAWTESTDNVGVTGYQLERCTGAGCSNFVLIATVQTVTYSNTGLAASTSYGYRVRATDAAGNFSGYSSAITVTTQAAPPADPCVTTPLSVRVTSWPNTAAGSRQLKYTSSQALTGFSFDTNLTRAVFTDTRGCTVTLVK